MKTSRRTSWPFVASVLLPTSMSVASIGSTALAGDAPKVSFQFGSPTTIMTTADMNQIGLQFPDGPAWFVRAGGHGQLEAIRQHKAPAFRSENLLEWSAPVTAFSLDSASNLRVYYPSVAGTGADPQVPDRTFYLYFLVRGQPASGALRNPQWMRQQVEVAR